MSGQVFNEDCLETLKRDLCYDYVITSPPDFEEVGLNPKNDDDRLTYNNFLMARLTFLPRSGLYTVFVSDRRCDGHIIAKSELISALCGADDILSHKIWIKSYKTNLYRPNFVHILTFGKDNHTKTPPIPDAFYDEFHAVGKYRDNFSLDVVKKFIAAYTKEGDTVYDPFMGSGTTALACLELNRKYLGSEIVPEVYALCNERIERINESITARKMVEKTQCPSGTN